MRVLIFEDEWLIATVIERTLLEAGIEVAGIAGSVALAVQMIEDIAFDVAIIDANLRGASAEPIAAALSKRGQRYLVISGYTDRQQLGSLAAAPFLGKPFAAHILVAAVQQLNT
jgi:DNA-binding response OmpR family regulator